AGMMRFLRPLLNDEFLSRFIRPLMRDLGNRYEETVSWFVPHGFEQVVVEVIPSPHPIRYVLETGGRTSSPFLRSGCRDRASKDG
ncbi:MAG: hypothetical protein AAGD34_09335, partial [Pseudomonadota bacterium]